MFCPNCGTQNPDTAQTCSKCNFNVKGAAAPKFKGTMLMMNQPIPGAPPGVGGQPAAPQAAAPPPAAAAPASAMGGSPSVPGAPPRPAGASAVPSKLKGTMVGVAPMSGGGAPSPVAVPGMGAPNAFPPTMPMAAVPALAGQAPALAGQAQAPPRTPTPVPPPMAAPPGYAPPHGQGVNPLGGTVAADGGQFAQYAQQAAAAAAAGAPNMYGQPPPGMGGAPPYGAPPGQQPYGAPQGGGAPYGTTPNPYQPPGYGNPMSPQGGMMPYGGAAGGPQGALQGTLPSHGAVGAGPTKRNALMTFLLPIAVMFGGSIVGTILAIAVAPVFGLLSTLACLGGGVWYLLFTIQMVNELKTVTGSADFAWWPILIPFYNYYWLLVLLPTEVTKAKQMRGVQAPTRNIILYFFLGNFALASDLNDFVR